MSRGTYAGIGKPEFDGFLRLARDGDVLDLGGLEVRPFTVPHDAREPLQLSCTDGSAKLGILTDLGHVTSHVLEHLAACDALLLECNHDMELLQNSAYPAFLKRRVGGQFGHLSNAAAAEALAVLRHGKLRHLVAAHLSIQNNRPELVQKLLATTLARDLDDITIARPDTGTCWLQA